MSFSTMHPKHQSVPSGMGFPWTLTPERMERFNFDDTGRFKDALDVLLDIDRNLSVVTKLNSLAKGFTTRQVTIGTTPSLIHLSPRPRGLLIINPSLSAGITNSGTILSSAARAPGTYTTRLSPLGVANYNTLSLFLNITANAAGLTLTVDVESRDQLSLGWMGVQGDVFGGTNAVRTDGAMGYYANLGPLGIDVDTAVEAIVGAGAGTLTFSIGYTLKDGLPGTGSGLSSAVYVGSSEAVSSTGGFPILPGDRAPFLIQENCELWGVALADGLTLQVWELS